jgi:hypothetical protein
MAAINNSLNSPGERTNPPTVQAARLTAVRHATRDIVLERKSILGADTPCNTPGCYARAVPTVPVTLFLLLTFIAPPFRQAWWNEPTTDV